VKRYNDITALKSISLDVADGEFLGILGPNGAGKTTLINIINTLLDYDSGKVLINGINPRENKTEIKKQIGVIPQEISLYEELSAFENLIFWGSLYDIEKEEIDVRAEELLRMVGLFKRKDDLVKTFSGGMKRRLNIAIGLIHNPKILLLDEPTVGVDPQSRNFIFDILFNLHEVGKTIIYTTHYMEEAEKLCEKIAILNKGEIIKYGTLEELLGNFEYSQIDITFTDIPSKELIAELSEYFNVKLIQENKLQIRGERLAARLQEIIKITHNLGIIDIKYTAPNLEQLFLYLTGKQLRD
jgi:ABC-2 type transport system ATP-binding protein